MRVAIVTWLVLDAAVAYVVCYSGAPVSESAGIRTDAAAEMAVSMGEVAATSITGAYKDRKFRLHQDNGLAGSARANLLQRHAGNIQLIVKGFLFNEGEEHCMPAPAFSIIRSR